MPLWTDEFSITKMPWGKKRRSTASSTLSTNSSLLSDSSSMASKQSRSLLLPQCLTRSRKPALPDYAEMMDEDNMAWGPSQSRRR